MLITLKSRRRAATVALAAAVSAGAVTVVALDSGSAHAAPTFAALNGPVQGPPAASDPVMQGLARANPKLVLSDAHAVIDDGISTVWLTRSTDGDVCLIEKLKPPPPGSAPRAIVISRFACKTPTDVAKEGFVAGVPGNFYGIVPDGVTEVSATVSGTSRAIAVSNGAFRVPAATSTVTVGGLPPIALPTPG